MSICLVMIVKDEAANLFRCLDAAKKVANSVFLIDTGSTDGTQEFARAWAKVNDVPLDLVEEPWENFQTNRSSLLRQAAGRADWLLMLDADLVIHAPDPLPDLERADSWKGWVKFAAMDYTLPFLVRGSKPWKYEGVAHAYLACDEPFDEATIDGLWVEDYSHTTVEKLERDLVALSAEHARNPLHPRTAFYLAQTYYDLDRFPEAIQHYRARAYMRGGWDEETYYAAYRLGRLLCEHVSFAEGAKELLRAWEMRPTRTEALRALAGCAGGVADKIPKPPDQLFVHNTDYVAQVSPSANGHAQEPPPFPNIAAGKRRRPRITKLRGLDPRDVSAVIVTRGNVDLTPTLAPLPFDDVVVWNNAEREHDYKVVGRYAAIPETKNPVIFWVDDDVVFSAFDELLAAYEPGRLVCNMDKSWVEGAGYKNRCGMQGAGSLCDADIPARIWAQYLAAYPWDDDALVEGDFVFGALVPFTVVDLGYQVRKFSDDPDRLYMQPGQTERKHRMIERCLALNGGAGGSQLGSIGMNGHRDPVGAAK